MRRSIEKYCKTCNKTFTVNYDSICCDFCSFWHHFECSGLSKTEFDNLSSKPDTPWKCIPCKDMFKNKLHKTAIFGTFCAISNCWSSDDDLFQRIGSKKS